MLTSDFQIELSFKIDSFFVSVSQKRGGVRDRSPSSPFTLLMSYSGKMRRSHFMKRLAWKLCLFSEKKKQKKNDC